MAAHLVNRSIFLSTCQLLLRGAPVYKSKGFSAYISVKHKSTALKYSMAVRRKLLYRYSSTSIITSRSLSTADKTSVEDYIPAPPLPPVPEDTTEVVSVLNQLEPSLTSQGLGGWSPPGILQNGLEWLHVSAGLPWCITIAVATLIARTFLLPFFLKAQRNAAVLHNNTPEMQAIQAKIKEARQNGNTMETAKLSNDLMIFMKEKNCNPLKSALVALVQAPVFISFFIGLRQMANLPVESFKTGGMLWFTDLTIIDPYYLLPLMTCVTLFISIEVGAEGGLRMDQLQLARYAVRAIPVIIFPFIMNFPSAILCYWMTTNVITLLQIGLLKSSKIREFVKVPTRIKHPPQDLAKNKKGFVEGVKDTWNNSKITKEMADRTQRDHRNFNRAGIGPVPKTYKFDPTKQRNL